jgi:hypothetical protein
VNRRLEFAIAAAILAVMLAPTFVSAEVSRVEITARRDVAGGRSFGSTGPYEQIVGKLYFAVDPTNKRNLVIADLDKAPKNGAGKIELSADLVILKPRDANKGNGIALFDIVNRGRGVAFAKFNVPGTANGAAAPDEYGDGFLLNRGYTIVQVGWEFDARREGAVRIEVPAAAGVTGMARATFIPTSNSPEATVGDLVGYTSSDPASSENTLTVRDSPQAKATTIPRAKWHLTAGNVVTLDGGFEPGRIYELAYRAANPPVPASVSRRCSGPTLRPRSGKRQPRSRRRHLMVRKIVRCPRTRGCSSSQARSTIPPGSPRLLPMDSCRTIRPTTSGR